MGPDHTLDYPHKDIWVNGRHIPVTAIMESNVVPATAHESETFDFIRSWIAGTTIFSLKTSGSTGPPKTITIRRDQMIASAKLTEKALGLDPSFNALLCLDTRFIAGKMMIVRSFVTGMKLFVIDPCAQPLISVPIGRQIHFAALVPYQVISTLESKHPHLLDSLSVCIIGGAPLEERYLEKVSGCAGKFYMTYGMTETVSHIALRSLNDPEASDLFRTLPGVEIEKDERECLVIGAPYLEKKVITNDVVEIFSRNSFRWKGRYDNVINSGGIKISPEILERAIGKIFTRLNLTNRFFLHYTPDDKLGQRLVVVIESPLPEAAVLHAVSEAFEHTFSPHERVRGLYESSRFVMTDTQKVNRRESFITSRPVAGFFY